MDNLTHSLVGAVMGQAGLKKKTGLAMPALIIGANLPDVDAACFFWLEGTEHLGFRRGITHGPPALVLLPLILAGLLWWFDRWQTKRGKRPEGRLPVNFKWLFLLSFIGCLSHPLFDWFNVYGIRFLEPFSSQWFYGDTLFIIDVWLWAMLGLTTWFSLRREKRGGNWTKPAWVGIAVVTAYIGMNWGISAVARSDHSNFAQGVDVIASPPPLAFWEREIILYAPGAEPEIANPMRSYWRMFGESDYFMPLPPVSVYYLVDGSLEMPSPTAKQIAERNSQVSAFLFWARAPFVACSDQGEAVLHDARFYDPLARDRFSIALPEVECVPLTSELPSE